MRLLVHRGQALLLLVVGGLLGATAASVALSGDARPAAIALHLGGPVATPDSGMPARIAIGDSRQLPAYDPETAGSSTRPSPVPSPAARTATRTVVTPPVYAYQPDDHGGHDRSGGGSPGHH
jgi:hypothetical protein